MPLLGEPRRRRWLLRVGVAREAVAGEKGRKVPAGGEAGESRVGSGKGRKGWGASQGGRKRRSNIKGRYPPP